MEKEKISVIVPIYNAQKWLSLCIKSILRQSYKNLEIILVDDGSTDKSPGICDRFEKKDERIIVIHNSNGGVSAARNAGLDKASGEYICFVDSDDYLPENAIEIMCVKMRTNQLDYCNGAAFCLNPVHNQRFKAISGVTAQRNDTETWCRFLDQQEWGPWAKLFKNSIIRENGLRFPLDVKYGEDTIFVSTYLFFCNRVMTIDENLYYYNCLNISSASNKFYPELLRWSKNIVVNYSKLIPNDFENKRYFVQRYAMKLYRMVNELYVINGRELEEKTIVDLLRQAYEEFREYLFDFSLERNDGDPSVEESVVEYKEFIGKCDFEGLYFYLIKKTEKNESTVKTTIRNLCRNIKTLSLKIKSFMLYVK